MGTEEENRTRDRWKKPLETNDKQREKPTGLIDEKHPIPVGVWGGKPILSLSFGAYYFFFAFLVEPLVGGRPRFRLVLRVRAVGGRTIVGRDPRGWPVVLLFCAAGPSHGKSRYRGSNHRRLSHRRCSIDERRGRFSKGKRTDQPMKNLLTQGEMRRKTVAENFL